MPQPILRLNDKTGEDQKLEKIDFKLEPKSNQIL